MITRTRQTTVHFTAPFALTAVDGIQSPGDYLIDEELIGGLSRIAYRRIATFIHLPAVSSGHRLQGQLMSIDHSELEAVLLQGPAQTLRKE